MVYDSGTTTDYQHATVRPSLGEMKSALVRATQRRSIPFLARISTMRRIRVPLRDLLIGAALFGLALWVGLGHVATTPPHRDESRWVGRAYFWNELFQPNSSTWADGVLTRNQPPLGSYLMGLGLTIQGHDTTTTARNLLYDFTRSERWNQLRGRIPSIEDRDAGRRTDSFVGALVVLLTYAVARRLTNRVGGVAAALVLIPNSLYIYLASLAGSDMLLTFFVISSALTALALADRPTWWRAILLGVLLGLGTSTKLSPMLVAALVASYGVLLLIAGQPWRRRTDEDRTTIGLGLMLLTVPFTAFATFVLSYPYLWPDPIRRTIYMFQFRSGEMESQGELWEDRQVLGTFDALSRIRFHYDEQFSVSRWLSNEVQVRFGRGWDLPWLDLALGTLGVGLLVLLAAHHGLRSKYALVALLLLGQSAVTIAGLQADFERYYMPIVVMFSVGIGVLIGMGWDWAPVVQRFATTRLARRRPPPAQFSPSGAVASVSPRLSVRERARAAFWSLPTATPRSTPEPATSANRGTSAFRALLIGLTMALGIIATQFVDVVRSRR